MYEKENNVQINVVPADIGAKDVFASYPSSRSLQARLQECLVPNGADKDHPALNVFGPKGSWDYLKEMNKFPAAIVVVGGFDPLKDRQKKYYEKLQSSGKEAYLVEYDKAFHTFHAFPEVPESSLMIAELQSFMEKQRDKEETRADDE